MGGASVFGAACREKLPEKRFTVVSANAHGVLVLAGATASGKTQLAIDLAKMFDAEIINADSRQIYTGMEVGTAAPTPTQLREVPHHLVGFLSPNEAYSAARFVIDASTAIRSVHQRGKRAIVVGGTGFYIRALCGDMGLAPEHDEAIRMRIREESAVHETEFLHGWLATRDAKRAAMIPQNDAYRIGRALEIVLSPTPPHERTLPTLRQQNIPFAKVILDLETIQLDERIALRTDAMLKRGFVEEAERIGASVPAANAVGYPQALAYLMGAATADELRMHLIRATRRYARRQRTWFRSEPYALWLKPGDVEAAAREFLGWT